MKNKGDFFALLEQSMEQQGVSAKKLSEGICSVSMISRVRQGERVPDQMLRDRLMNRLGISEERSENFLCYEDYIKWKARMTILKCVDYKETAKARRLLVEYARSEDFAHSIEQQFYHAMDAQLMMYERTDDTALADKLETALKLTVPNIDQKRVTDLQLATIELNLILEYEKYRHPARLIQRCDEILQYIDQSALDDENKAKIFPKAAWYQCVALSKEPDINYPKILKNSTRAIEYLRTTKKMYYLWELLSAREEALDAWAGKLRESGEEKRANVLARMCQENHDWKRAIMKVYEQCGLPPQTNNFCYLYIQPRQVIYCINEVIRRRRKMLDISRKELCEGICDEKTIERLEKDNAKTQMPILRELFKRLNFSGELQQEDIVTDSREALDLLHKLVKYINNFDYANVKKTLQELVTHLDMEIPQNRQYVTKAEGIQLWLQGEENGEQAFRKAKEALECTISLETIKTGSSLYLTDGEVSCIHNMALYTGTDKMNDYWEILERLRHQYESDDEVDEHLKQYEWLTSSLANVFSMAGMYAQSNNYAQKVILLDVRYRRIDCIAHNLNFISWNNTQAQEKDNQINAEKDRISAVKSCIALSQFSRETHFEAKYRQIYKKLTENC